MKQVRLIQLFFLTTIVFIISGCGNNPPDVSNDESETSTVSDVKAENEKEAVKNGFDGMPSVGTSAYCPIMKHDFKVTETTESSVHDGKTYVFCCPGCKPQFDKEPTKYI